MSIEEIEQILSENIKALNEAEKEIKQKQESLEKFENEKNNIEEQEKSIQKIKELANKLGNIDSKDISQYITKTKELLSEMESVKQKKGEVSDESLEKIEKNIQNVKEEIENEKIKIETANRIIDQIKNFCIGKQQILEEENKMNDIAYRKEQLSPILFEYKTLEESIKNEQTNMFMSINDKIKHQEQKNKQKVIIMELKEKYPNLFGNINENTEFKELDNIFKSHSVDIKENTKNIERLSLIINQTKGNDRINEEKDSIDSKIEYDTDTIINPAEPEQVDTLSEENIDDDWLNYKIPHPSSFEIPSEPTFEATEQSSYEIPSEPPFDDTKGEDLIIDKTKDEIESLFGWGTPKIEETHDESEYLNDEPSINSSQPEEPVDFSFLFENPEKKGSLEDVQNSEEPVLLERENQEPKHDESIESSEDIFPWDTFNIDDDLFNLDKEPDTQEELTEENLNELLGNSSNNIQPAFKEQTNASEINEQKANPYICVTLDNSSEEKYTCLSKPPLFGHFKNFDGKKLLKSKYVTDQLFNEFADCYAYGRRKYGVSPTIDAYAKTKSEQTIVQENDFEHNKPNQKIIL